MSALLMAAAALPLLLPSPHSPVVPPPALVDQCSLSVTGSTSAALTDTQRPDVEFATLARAYAWDQPDAGPDDVIEAIRTGAVVLPSGAPLNVDAVTAPRELLDACPDDAVPLALAREMYRTARWADIEAILYRTLGPAQLEHLGTTSYSMAGDSLRFGQQLHPIPAPPAPEGPSNRGHIAAAAVLIVAALALVISRTPAYPKERP